MNAERARRDGAKAKHQRRVAGYRQSVVDKLKRIGFIGPDGVATKTMAQIRASEDGKEVPFDAAGC